MAVGGRSLIGIGVLTTPPFEPFYGSVGAQSTTQPWHNDPLTPLPFDLGIHGCAIHRNIKNASLRSGWIFPCKKRDFYLFPCDIVMLQMESLRFSPILTLPGCTSIHVIPERVACSVTYV